MPHIRTLSLARTHRDGVGDSRCIGGALPLTNEPSVARAACDWAGSPGENAALVLLHDLGRVRVHPGRAGRVGGEHVYPDRVTDVTVTEQVAGTPGTGDAGAGIPP